jgi:hypothetical protein
VDKQAKKHWFGKDGVNKNKYDVFKFPERVNERVKRVLEYVLMYEARGQVYNGEWLKGQGAKPLLLLRRKRRMNGHFASKQVLRH